MAQKLDKKDPIALTPAEREILEEIVAGKHVDKDTKKMWISGRQERNAAKKLVAAGFLTGPDISRSHWHAITDAGRAALKAPAADLCAGCDAVLPKGVYSSGPGGYVVTIAPSVEVRVCYGRSHSYASDACTTKARVRARRCPGCGAENTDIGRICDDCKTNVERGRTLKGRKLEWWCIVANGLGPYLSFDVKQGEGRSGGNRAYPLEELAELLGTALAVGRIETGHRYNKVDDGRMIPSGNGVRIDSSDKVYVEVTHEQGEAMAALVKMIRQVMYLAYRSGLHDGKDALGRLARGDTSVRDFERHGNDQDRTLDRILAEFEEQTEKEED